MCLLSYYPPNTIPQEEYLWNGAAINNDGHGYAIVTNDGLITGKAMAMDEVIKDFLSLREAYPEGPAMFHSRMGTSGVHNEFNCHPFQMGTDPNTVLAHNGIFFKVPTGERRCDTHIFAQSIMPRQFRRLDRPGVKRYLERYLGSYNKVVVLTTNPRYRRNAYIFNEEAGIWTSNKNDQNEWHSNSDFRGYYVPLKGKYGKYVYYDMVDDDEDYPSFPSHTADSVIKSAEESAAVFAQQEGLSTSTVLARRSDSKYLCVNCLHADCIDHISNICEECGACQDCGDNVSDCQCYYMKDSGGVIITKQSIGMAE